MFGYYGYKRKKKKINTYITRQVIDEKTTLKVTTFPI